MGYRTKIECSCFIKTKFDIETLKVKACLDTCSESPCMRQKEKQHYRGK